MNQQKQRATCTGLNAHSTAGEVLQSLAGIREKELRFTQTIINNQS